ncbi:pimeloyl-ACP methyl ester carboxylesterase [Lipingzhangella halophila]|uniref:Pimeloyl-ACP methyl ester carboxylesterase n=1 Tax=Lipingzhangella halophila TaxID=1783352 RepID=A0A7W7RII3_9ACTN|nr:alpha/beta hydrolase [Lipingzhangella halophila]MBB4932527.1 pimeloyl-ACP methyl ester carboxylesterase [Lipingzhangella halophila]
MNTHEWGPTRWARNGDVRLAFDTLAGTSGGEPLLLVMGLGVSRAWWPDGLCRTLAEYGFAVARYDQRDAGESTHLPAAKARLPVAALLARRGEAYTAEDMADDAAAVLDGLGWESAHLVGVSLGGAVAQRVAVRHPDRVRTLTSISAVPGDVGGLRTLRYIHLPALARLSRMKFPNTKEGAIQASLAVDRFCASPAYPFDEREARARAERLADAGARDTQAQSRQIGAQWRGAAISTITVPTLVLHGRDDPLIRPSAASAIASRIPGARLVTLPGVGHDIPAPVWHTVAAEVRGLADSPTGSAEPR